MISDTGPLIAYARLQRLELLHQVAGTVLIPDAVFREMIARGTDRPGAAEVTHSTWIQHHVVARPNVLLSFPAALHLGEREAILLAEEQQAPLLIDEQRGREFARSRGVTVLGSLWGLKEAKRHGIIPAVRPIVLELLNVGYWLDETTIIRPFLQEMGEDDSTV